MTRSGIRLPPEVWQQIFERSFIPANLIDCFAPQAENSHLSLVAERKRTLMSVCKDWYRANKRYLYEHIDIKRPTQLLALSRSLKNWSENTSLVKHLHIRCYATEEWKGSFSTKLQDVVDHLPNLTGFFFGHDVFAGTYTLPRFRNAIRELHTAWLLPTIPTVSASSSPNAFPGLRILSLFVDSETQWRGHSPLFANSLDFPELEQLEICAATRDPSGAMLTITSWTLPSLKRLILRLSWLPMDKFNEVSMPLLTTHGCFLEELQLHCRFIEGTEGMVEPSEPINLASLCPNLRHLVLNWNQWQKLSHPGVQWIDFWLSWSESNVKTRNRWQELPHKLIEPKSFPSLQGTRVLDMQLSGLTNIAFDIPPWSVQNRGDTFEIEFMGYTIRHEEGILKGTDLWEYASEDDSDFEYESPPESDEEGGDSSDSDNESTFFSTWSDSDSDIPF
ncbi:hypothetical protein BKA70DRAFT_646918 [Coprinopsis sp. MPI-PUGE-AT-0042]|nr:hypothetical protein BKA70DRAFT_646918 [Coprinopsis sp. MPI-PUGE-AT-0042]